MFKRLNAFYLLAMALLIAGAISETAGGVSARADEQQVNTAKDGLAIHGYDPVAYFTEGRPVQGSPAFAYDWNGARYRFATAVNRDKFASDPARFAPQYGGFCAYAVSRGYTADVDPQAWAVVDGKLYLNYSKRVQRQWQEDVPGNIRKADANWPNLRNKS